MKPLLVGESPSRSGDRYWMFPLSGAVAQALCQMAWIPPQPDYGSRYGRWTWALYDRFDCVNVVERYPYGGWPREEAASTLERVLENASSDYEVVVLLGRRAQQAYVDAHVPAESVVDGLGFYEWVIDPTSPTGRREVVALPHPSGLNRVYNDPSARRRAGVILNEAIEKARCLEETRL
jgi:uracil-DNA glycosylase